MTMSAGAAACTCPARAMQENTVVVEMAINNLDNLKCLTPVLIIVEVALTRCRATCEVCRAHPIERGSGKDLHK
ncbi:hypothetical protein D3C71_1937100 [compost metagenome]